MISYIFKNKTKNILAIIFTVLCIVNPLYELMVYIVEFHTLLNTRYTLLNLLAYILILVYLLMLKNEYKLKSFLFPVAFLLQMIMPIYVAVIQTRGVSSYFEGNDKWHLTFTIILLNNFILVVGKFLCFAGSLINFKYISLLKIGVVLNVACIAILTPILEVVNVIESFGTIGAYFDSNGTISVTEIFQRVINLLFYVGILLLAFNKKSENIDITPFVEARCAKREAKKAAKLETKKQEEARLNEPIPEIAEGFWRCMACGKILPDSIDRCECGYKK